jgi:D-alanyl-D-alanine carboxypeptidase
MPRMLPDFDAYVRSFAEGGSSGTLKKRMAAVPDSLARVWCKTGYIAGTSCLSGYVLCSNGRRFAMSVLCNDLKENQVGKAKDLQDEIASILARQPAR